MRLTISKNDREGLLNCCGRQPFVRVFIDFEDQFQRQFDITCPVCSSYVSADTFALAKSHWNASVELDNDFMLDVRSLDNEGST